MWQIWPPSCTVFFLCLSIFRSQLRCAFRTFESTQIRPPTIIIIKKNNYASMSNYVDNYKTKTFWMGHHIKGAQKSSYFRKFPWEFARILGSYLKMASETSSKKVNYPMYVWSWAFNTGIAITQPRYGGLPPSPFGNTLNADKNTDKIAL